MKSSASLVAAITSVAIVLSEGRSTDEIELLGAIFTQLGDTLTTISVNDAILEKEAVAATSAASDSQQPTTQPGTDETDDTETDG